MRLDLETRLWAAVPTAQAFGVNGPPAREIAKMLAEGVIDNPKQAWRTLEKWARRGVYEYGVSIDHGWRVTLG